MPWTSRLPGSNDGLKDLAAASKDLQYVRLCILMHYLFIVVDHPPVDEPMSEA